MGIRDEGNRGWFEIGLDAATAVLGLEEGGKGELYLAALNHKAWLGR
jgi:hypothetical protein